MNTYIVSDYHGLSASLILAGGKGFAGTTSMTWKERTILEVLIEIRRLYMPFATKQLERTATRGIELPVTFWTRATHWLLHMIYKPSRKDDLHKQRCKQPHQWHL